MIWRASHNALPTLCNLARRIVVKFALCSGCNSVHALWSCKSLITIWEPEEIIKKFFKYYFNSFADLWEMFLRMRDRLDLNLVARLFWFKNRLVRSVVRSMATRSVVQSGALSLACLALWSSVTTALECVCEEFLEGEV